MFGKVWGRKWDLPQVQSHHEGLKRWVVNWHYDVFGARTTDVWRDDFNFRAIEYPPQAAMEVFSATNTHVFPRLIARYRTDQRLYIRHHRQQASRFRRRWLRDRSSSRLSQEGERQMASASYFAKGNKLLQSLSASDMELLVPNLVPVELKLREDLERPNKPIENIFFIENAIASVVAVPLHDVRVEIGMIGCEGMTGTAIVAGSDRSPYSTYIHAKGKARRISVVHLNGALDGSTTLRAHLVKFVHAFAIQSAHTAVANARAKLDIRLARWLLMAHDRVPGNTLPLTHEFLALMLACRRAGVTEAVHALTKQGFISARRGEITVLDRKGLEKAAGKFYGIPEAEYRRLMN